MRMKAQTLARIVGFVALAMVSACGPAGSARDASEQGPQEGFTLEIFAHEGEQIYLVRHADGRRAAAHVVNGQSSIMDGGEAQTRLIDSAADINPPGDEDLSIRAPGFSLSVASDETGGTSDRARIEIQAGGQSVLVDAQGEHDRGSAVVRIAGADADTARNFIEEADGLSAQTRAEMLRALAL
ncbi:MAG: hypothetical protein AB7J28_08300 [Hyphomonadaceae bacterium]